MPGFLKDVKDSDKVGLLILYTGLLVTTLGVLLSAVLVLYVKPENVLDRILSIVMILISQGGALVTGAMIVLRFQSKSGDNPPTPPVLPKEP